MQIKAMQYSTKSLPTGLQSIVILGLQFTQLVARHLWGPPFENKVAPQISFNLNHWIQSHRSNKWVKMNRLIRSSSALT